MCIVLRTADYRDSDKMLTLFSREAGRVSALARGAKNLKNPLAAASQPFCCGIFSFTGKNGKLYVSQCEIKKEFYSLGADFEKFAAACVMVEMADKILEDSVEYERLFVLLANCLSALEKGPPVRMTLAYFFVQISDILGIRPTTDTCAVCGKDLEEPDLFCASEGGAVCEQCAAGLHTKKIRPEAIRMIDVLLKTDPKSIALIEKFNSDVLAVMRDYLSSFGEITSRAMNYL